MDEKSSRRTGYHEGLEKGMEQGVEKGIEQGIKKEKLEIAKRMLEERI